MPFRGDSRVEAASTLESTPGLTLGERCCQTLKA
jgi:hypothetical protein